jgi:diguanylate cyclase (GGDEF)-like protein
MSDGLARVEAAAEPMAVMCIDLDNFKTVNDTLGHPFGDRLLRSVGERLRSVIGDGDTIARIGGDEFAVLQAAACRPTAERLARSLIEAMSQPIVIDEHEFNSGISIGIAIAPQDGIASDELMKCADLALYRAKADGRNTFRFFEKDMGAQVRARRALELDLRRAFTAGSFDLVYQPLVSLVSGELSGMEALLRWTHDERGPISPAEFIPLAEETGLIVPLGEWVLRRACAEAARWPEPIRVAVNLSPLQFRSPGLVATVANALANAGLASRRLEFEITEAVLLQNDETILGILHQLRSLGIRISMDDFGTGYSSLGYLRSFPFDKIKIDRSFISATGRETGAIIGTIASLGAALGIETTAEGVETSEQLEVVRRAGCTEVQGYLISRPLPAPELPHFIAQFSRIGIAA